MNLILIGSTEKCLRHLTAHYDVEKTRDLLVQLCGEAVKRTTIMQWLRPDSKLPTGENLLRLRCFLQLAGYGVDELLAVNNQKRLVSHMIAMGSVEADELRTTIQYPHLQQLWKFLMTGMASSKAEPKLKELTDRLGETTELEVGKWGAYIREALGVHSAAPQSRSVTVPVQPEAVPQQVLGDNEVVRLFAQMVASTKTFADLVGHAEVDQQLLAKHTRDGRTLQGLRKSLDSLLATLDVKLQ